MGQPLRSLDDLIRRLGASSEPRGMRDAAESVYAAEKSGWRMAEDLLHLYPESLGRADQVIGDNKMSLGRYLGSGAESLVWEALPRSGEAAQVVKVRVGDAAPTDFSAGHPADVAGVVPYWGESQVGPGVAVAFQPMAKAVYSRGMYAAPFSSGAERVRQSLLARGIDWSDAHKSNVGAMPDGTWGVIDGWVFPAHPSWGRPDISPEDAVRMLKITPDEAMAIRGLAE